MPDLLGIGISFILIILCSLLSFYNGQKLHKEFISGALRACLQLILLGYVLTWIFRNENLLIILLISLLMTLNSALHSKRRNKVQYPFLLLDNLVAIMLTIWPLAFFGSALLKTDPLWKVEIFLPLLGMLLGNTLNGISLGVDFFGSEFQNRREEVLSLVALGATVKEATSPLVNRSLRIAMTPTLNAMASMGVVSIPGMMTGQILGGVAPSEAAIMQIIIMLLISVGTFCGTNLALVLARRHKFEDNGVPCFG